VCVCVCVCRVRHYLLIYVVTNVNEVNSLIYSQKLAFSLQIDSLYATLSFVFVV